MSYNIVVDSKSVMQAKDDPQGYVTDSPCPVLSRANSAAQRALAKVSSLADDTAESVKAEAWRRYNLVRLFANVAGRTGSSFHAEAAELTERSI